MKISHPFVQLALFSLFTGSATADVLTFILPNAVGNDRPVECCSGPRWGGLFWLAPTPTAFPLSDSASGDLGDPLDPFHWISYLFRDDAVDSSIWGVKFLFERDIVDLPAQPIACADFAHCTQLQDGVPVIVDHILWSDGTVDDLVFRWDVAVPEPGSAVLALSAIGIVITAGTRRKRRARYREHPAVSKPPDGAWCYHLAAWPGQRLQYSIRAENAKAKSPAP